MQPAPSCNSTAPLHPASPPYSSPLHSSLSTARRVEPLLRSRCCHGRSALFRQAEVDDDGLVAMPPLFLSSPSLLPRHASPPPHTHPGPVSSTGTPPEPRCRRSGSAGEPEHAAEEPRCPSTCNSTPSQPEHSAADSDPRRRPEPAEVSESTTPVPPARWRHRMLVTAIVLNVSRWI